MPSVLIKRNKEHRLLSGHPWVYRGEIQRVSGDAADGDEVEIRDHRERFLGRGLINRQSQITVRRFTTDKEPLDRAFFERRLRDALARRGDLGAHAACRVVCSEGDQLPGLIVDRYADHVVYQALTLGIERRKTMVEELLREVLQPRAIVERSDQATRKLEGLEPAAGVRYGETTGIVRVCLAGTTFEAHLLEDQKTGLYLDQAENYQLVGAAASGRRVLDCFSCQGGFSLAAARAGAVSVEAIESSETALARAQTNTEINAVQERVVFTAGNAFDLLKRYQAEKREYDLIVLDPPSFTRNRQSVPGALRGYKEINLRALKMLGRGGLLATFTCSHHITAELFREVVVAAAGDARRSLRLVRSLRQAADHPILPAVPETEYLKGMLLEVI